MHPWARTMYREGFSFNGNERSHLWLADGGALVDLSDTAGGEMTPEFVSVRPDMRIGDAIKLVRSSEDGAVGPDPKDRIEWVHIIQGAQMLLGSDPARAASGR